MKFKIFFLSVIITVLNTANVFSQLPPYWNECFDSEDCDLVDIYTTGFNVPNSNSGGFCSGKVTFKIYKCDGPPLIYKVLITNVEFIACDNTPAPDAKDIIREAQKQALVLFDKVVPSPPPFKTVEITIPTCLNVNGPMINPPIITNCGECCTSTYTIGNGSIYLPTSYSDKVCQEITSCEAVCEYSDLPLGELDQNSYPYCGYSTDYQVTGYVMGSLTNDINLDFFANTRSGVDAAGDYHLTVFNISTISGSSNTITDANGFREMMDYIFANITSYMPSSYNYENIFLHLNTCWKQDNWALIPCSNDCCTLEFDVTNGTPPTYNCLTSISPMSCISPCFEVCEEVAKIKTPTPKINFDSKVLNEKLDILPNPSKGETSIIYSSKSTGAIQIAISNLKGEQLFNNSSIKESDKFQLNLNTNEFANGVYIIQIYLNGKNVSNTKFIINN